MNIRCLLSGIGSESKTANGPKSELESELESESIFQVGVGVDLTFAYSAALVNIIEMNFENAQRNAHK